MAVKSSIPIDRLTQFRLPTLIRSKRARRTVVTMSHFAHEARVSFGMGLTES